MAKRGESSPMAPASLASDTTPATTTISIATPEDAPTDSILCHFSRSQVALAFAIERSRPEGVSTTEYCQRLRKRIKTGRNIPSQEHRYVDSSNFWKDEYHRIYLEKKSLEDKVRILEEELRLRRETASQDDCQNMQPQRLTIQQLMAQPTASTTDASKKPLLSHDVQLLSRAQLNLEVMETSEADNNLLRISGYVLKIGRERSKIEKITRNSDPGNPQVAIAQSREFILLVGTAISECCIPLRYLRTNTEDVHTLHLLQQLMHQVSLAVQTSFTFLNVIRQAAAGESKKSHVVYRIVIFFDHALKLLHQLANMQAAYENKGKGHISLHEPNMGDSEYAVNKYLAEALSSIASNLKWEAGKPGHRPILEGVLCAVLKQTGRLVSEAIFQEHVGSSEALGNVTESTARPNGNTTILEYRYILQVLYAALGGSERKGLVAEILAGKPPLTQWQHNTSKLLSGEKNRIQSMLIKSVLGGDELEGLNSPTPPVEDIEISTIADAKVVPYGSVWFIERVWAMVGWDMVV